MLGLGGTAVVARLRRRIQALVDVEEQTEPRGVIGVLPAMAESDDDEALSSVDHCVHHIRTLLQLRGDAAGAERNGTVVAVTSPTAGAGKTTVSLALGFSFRASGSRTLLVDCDLVGHGLTSQSKRLLRRSACRLLDRRTNGNGHELGSEDSRHDVAFHLCDVPHAGAADALPSLEELTQRARGVDGHEGDRAALHLLDAVARQEGAENRPGRAAAGTATERQRRVLGILDALEGSPLRDCVLPSGMEGMDVLTAGAATHGHVSRVTPERIQRLFAACRQEYDTIIVDTGPILGSLEACAVAASADTVLLAVSRGDLCSLTDAALGRLDLLGAPLSGVVFNRAERADVERASYSYSSQTRSRRAVSA